MDGLGIANLPYLTVEADIASGRLVHILPDWCSNIGTVQLVYASRKGQRLVMEKLIEHLSQGLRDFASTCRGLPSVKAQRTLHKKISHLG